MKPPNQRKEAENPQTPALKMDGKKTMYSRKPVETSRSDRFAATAQGLRPMDLRSENGGACGNVTGAPGAPALVEQTVLDQPGIKLFARYL
jgi:hypothetical protein